MKSKGLLPRLFYPGRPSFKIEGEIRTCPEKRRVKECTSTKSALQEKLKGLLSEKGKKE